MHLEFCWQPLIILSVAEQRAKDSETWHPLVWYRTFWEISVRRYKVIKLLKQILYKNKDLYVIFFFFFYYQENHRKDFINITINSPGNNNVANSNTLKMEDRAILNLPDSFGWTTLIIAFICIFISFHIHTLTWWTSIKMIMRVVKRKSFLLLLDILWSTFLKNWKFGHGEFIK